MSDAINKILDTFTCFHDGVIEEYEGDSKKLVLKIGCTYLAELIEPTFDYFFVEFKNVILFEFEGWLVGELGNEIINNIENIIKLQPEILSADIEGNYIEILCNADYAENIKQGLLKLNSEEITIYNQDKVEISLVSLEQLCSQYWNKHN